MAIDVDDADRYYEEWSRRVQVLRPPHDEPWGARTFYLLDPFGNTLFVRESSTRTARPPRHRPEAAPAGCRLRPGSSCAAGPA
ncbi:MAG: VOC family protein [Acidobacteria bacterium]|nr:VOC family protein [Acidobacteriota bacterium]